MTVILNKTGIILRTNGIEIKSIVSLKPVVCSIPTVLSLDNGDIITNSYDITNTFNNYFASIAETTKKKYIFT